MTQYEPKGFIDSDQIIIKNGIPYFNFTGNSFVEKLKNNISLDNYFQQEVDIVPIEGYKREKQCVSIDPSIQDTLFTIKSNPISKSCDYNFNKKKLSKHEYLMAKQNNNNNNNGNNNNNINIKKTYKKNMKKPKRKNILQNYKNKIFGRMEHELFTIDIHHPANNNSLLYLNLIQHYKINENNENENENENNENENNENENKNMETSSELSYSSQPYLWDNDNENMYFEWL
jgi:hypothetical protein